MFDTDINALFPCLMIIHINRHMFPSHPFLFKGAVVLLQKSLSQLLDKYCPMRPFEVVYLF